MQTDRALASKEAYERRFAEEGKVIPGSPKEDAVLAHIDNLRDEEVERERAKHNRKLWSHLGRSRGVVTRIVYPSEAQ